MPDSRTFRRTRIAPTPSGFLHIGNAFSFRLTADLARETGAKILLRIDDLDRERVEARYIDDIFETLEFLNIPWDEGPRDRADFESAWSQLHRMELYRQALDELRRQGVLFACECSRTQIARESVDGGYPGTCRGKGLSLDRPDVSWRIRTGMLQELAMKTLDGILHPVAPDPSVKDFVVRKKDGMPAYQLTSLVDDLHFEVDLIVRGKDLLPSTQAQRYLATLLPGGAAFTGATFHHHDLFLDTGGEKLSKSAGATSIQALRREGKTPEQIMELAKKVIIS